MSYPGKAGGSRSGYPGQASGYPGGQPQGYRPTYPPPNQPPRQYPNQNQYHPPPYPPPPQGYPQAHPQGQPQYAPSAPQPPAGMFQPQLPPRNDYPQQSHDLRITYDQHGRPIQVPPRQHSFSQHYHPDFGPTATYSGMQQPQMAVPVWQPPPSEYAHSSNQVVSACNGRKKALLVGINYFGTKAQLNGCINDVHNVKNFLVRHFGFREDPNSMIILTDDQNSPHYQPTKRNIEEAMGWLVRDARPGDSLFFHYSGHGSQQKDVDGDESDGYDETICPVDYERAGQITDDDMNRRLVQTLPPGVRLTAIFDCCHSGSALDLPFTYYPDGRLKQSNKFKKLGGIAQNAAMSYLRGNMMGVVTGLRAGVQALSSQGHSQQQKEETKGNRMADVVMFSGCKDEQTSKDTRIQGVATGAMSHALISALTQYPGASYGQLLQVMKDSLRKYQQAPQLSTARYMDMNQRFLA